jgi:flagellar biosynthetic protein FlhB
MEDTHRTEPATPKRREEFRERGEVAKSRDLAGAFALLLSLGALAATGEALAREMRGGLKSALAALGEVRSQAPGAGLSDSLVSIALATAPILGAAVAAALIGHLGQTGLLFARKAIAFDLQRLFSLGKLKQIFSLQGFVEMAKSLAKLGLIGIVVYEVVSREMEAVTTLGQSSPAAIAGSLCGLCLRVAGYGGASLLGLGLLDYVFQRWQLEKKMRMSKDEIKEEMKRSEGDPLIKMRIRSKQREMARRRMMQSVKKADVVVTNPTHIAVALAYRPGEMGAPRVVAKGRGPIAERIKVIAREHGVPVMENRPLARALYKAVKIGREVPAALYRAVAEVLAYVYSRRRRGPDGRPLEMAT